MLGVSTEALAAYAAVVSTVATVVAAVVAWRRLRLERPHLKIRLQRPPFYPHADRAAHYAVIVNTGRRPITVVNIWLVLPGGKSRSPSEWQWKARTLSEGEFLGLPQPSRGPDRPEVVVQDSRGRWWPRMRYPLWRLGRLNTRIREKHQGGGLISLEPPAQPRNLSWWDRQPWWPALVAEAAPKGLTPFHATPGRRVLSGVMRSAVANRRIPSSPCIGVALPRAGRREMLVLVPESVQELAAEAGEPFGSLVLFAAYSGLRWGEIAALRVGRLDPLRGTVDVVESATEVGRGIQFVAPKNGRTRTVRLPRSLVEILAPMIAGKGSEELVFAGREGGPLRHGQFYSRVFRPAVARAGLDGRLRFHDLRHTCAALLIAQGAHPRAIMERLGHSSITVTMDVYGHLLRSLDDALAAGLHATLLSARADKPRTERGQVVALTG
jgi:integrase